MAPFMISRQPGLTSEVAVRVFEKLYAELSDTKRRDCGSFCEWMDGRDAGVNTPMEMIATIPIGSFTLELPRTTDGLRDIHNPRASIL